MSRRRTLVYLACFLVIVSGYGARAALSAWSWGGGRPGGGGIAPRREAEA